MDYIYEGIGATILRIVRGKAMNLLITTFIELSPGTIAKSDY
jgi:hypothetical protein